MSVDANPGGVPAATNVSEPPSPEAPEGDWTDWANLMPSVAALGLECTAMDEERAEFVLDSRFFPLNANGAVNGGLLVSAADQVMGVMAVRGARSHAYAFTISMAAQFHRSAMPPILVRAEFVPGGKRVAFVNVEMEGADGVRCASAQGALRMSAGERVEPAAPEG
ncbi:PaaI family thioesterase [Streptomyces sp. NPDC047453]|uniref:PaaI family thioesterase n=1 Tax=Streptomyces sp. NPDC047453 TaxID=3154812 RepID=UPI0033DFB8E0